MDYAQYIPATALKFARELAQCSTLTVVDDATTVKDRNGGRRGVLKTSGEIADFVKQLLEGAEDLQQTEQVTSAHLIALYGLGQGLMHGPKFVMPSLAQCEAAAHTDLKLTLGDYVQPFPCITVVWPRAWLDKLEHTGRAPALATTLYFDCEQKMLALVDHCAKQSMVFGTVYTTSLPLDQVLSAESHLPDAETRILSAQEATALTLCYLLTALPHTVVPGDRERMRKAAKRLTGEERERMEERADRLADLLSFEQHTALHTEVRETVTLGVELEPGAEPGHHASPVPHWRRGHIRHQRFGPNRSGVKKVFIKPVLVRKQAFAGTLSATTAEYRVDK